MSRTKITKYLMESQASESIANETFLDIEWVSIFNIYLPIRTAKIKTPIIQSIPMKIISDGLSLAGLGFFPILTAVLSPT